MKNLFSFIFVFFIFCFASCKKTVHFDINTPSSKSNVTMNRVYAVNFEPHGGTFDGKTQKIMEGDKIKMPSNPTKKDYVFGGWYRSDKNNKFSQLFDEKEKIRSNIVLYAKWYWKDVPANKEKLKNLLKDSSVDHNALDISGITDMSNFFSGDLANFNGKISDWDTSNVRNMRGVFYGATKFNQDISKWNVSNVTSMAGMFDEAKEFNQDISKWNVSKVKDMSGMFYGTEAFNGDVSKWDVSQVEKMIFMFAGAKDFNGDISEWNVSNVEDMSVMFYGAEKFNRDISRWDVSKVKDMKFMFTGASAFKQDISSWTISDVLKNANHKREIFEFSGIEKEEAKKPVGLK